MIDQYEVYDALVEIGTFMPYSTAGIILNWMQEQTPCQNADNLEDDSTNDYPSTSTSTSASNDSYDLPKIKLEDINFAVNDDMSVREDDIIPHEQSYDTIIRAMNCGAVPTSLIGHVWMTAMGVYPMTFNIAFHEHGLRMMRRRARIDNEDVATVAGLYDAESYDEEHYYMCTRAFYYTNQLRLDKRIQLSDEGYATCYVILYGLLHECQELCQLSSFTNYATPFYTMAKKHLQGFSTNSRNVIDKDASTSFRNIFRDIAEPSFCDGIVYLLPRLIRLMDPLNLSERELSVDEEMELTNLVKETNDACTLNTSDITELISGPTRALNGLHHEFIPLTGTSYGSSYVSDPERETEDGDTSDLVRVDVSSTTWSLPQYIHGYRQSFQFLTITDIYTVTKHIMIEYLVNLRDIETIVTTSIALAWYIEPSFAACLRKNVEVVNYLFSTGFNDLFVLLMSKECFDVHLSNLFIGDARSIFLFIYQLLHDEHESTRDKFENVKLETHVIIQRIRRLELAELVEIWNRVYLTRSMLPDDLITTTALRVKKNRRDVSLSLLYHGDDSEDLEPYNENGLTAEEPESCGQAASSKTRSTLVEESEQLNCPVEHHFITECQSYVSASYFINLAYQQSFGSIEKEAILIDVRSAYGQQQTGAIHGCYRIDITNLNGWAKALEDITSCSQEGDERILPVILMGIDGEDNRVIDKLTWHLKQKMRRALVSVVQGGYKAVHDHFKPRLNKAYPAEFTIIKAHDSGLCQLCIATRRPLYTGVKKPNTMEQPKYASEYGEAVQSCEMHRIVCADGSLEAPGMMKTLYSLEKIPTLLNVATKQMKRQKTLFRSQPSNSLTQIVDDDEDCPEEERHIGQGNKNFLNTTFKFLKSSLVPNTNDTNDNHDTTTRKTKRDERDQRRDQAENCHARGEIIPCVESEFIGMMKWHIAGGRTKESITKALMLYLSLVIKRYPRLIRHTVVKAGPVLPKIRAAVRGMCQFFIPVVSEKDLNSDYYKNVFARKKCRSVGSLRTCELREDRLYRLPVWILCTSYNSIILMLRFDTLEKPNQTVQKRACDESTDLAIDKFLACGPKDKYYVLYDVPVSLVRALKRTDSDSIGDEETSPEVVREFRKFPCLHFHFKGPDDPEHQYYVGKKRLIPHNMGSHWDILIRDDKECETLVNAILYMTVERQNTGSRSSQNKAQTTSCGFGLGQDVVSELPETTLPGPSKDYPKLDKYYSSSDYSDTCSTYEDGSSDSLEVIPTVNILPASPSSTKARDPEP